MIILWRPTLITGGLYSCTALKVSFSSREGGVEKLEGDAFKILKEKRRLVLRSVGSHI
ncbi:MAG: hypothetical protein ACE5Z5_09085 [Candidatus Bathyarchaeia archaeon]